MPQQKKTDVAPPIDVEGLEPLSDLEREFAHLIVRDGIRASEAYRRVFGAESIKDTTLWCYASQLRHSSKIQGYINALYQAGAHSGLISQQDFVRDMLALADRCEKAGNYGAAVNARDKAAKASGLYVEQFRDVTEAGDTAELLDAIEELAGSDARRNAARRLGIEEHEPVGSTGSAQKGVSEAASVSARRAAADQE